MNCGLTNLDTLKRHLLAESLFTSTQFDSVIEGIGLAVAGLFDGFCNRKLAYNAAAEEVFHGCRGHVVLPRYPIIAVSKVETKFAGDTAWTEETDEPALVNEGSGVVRFGASLGGEDALIRVTWSGGYWFGQLEPEEAGYPETLPTGATPLPFDLKGAFLTQCEQVWQTHDRLGNGIVGAGAGANFLNTRLSTLELVPLVKEMLRGHVRYALS